MKNYSLGWFSLIFFVIITSFTFTSCSDDDATDPNSGQIISPDTEVDDPIGTPDFITFLRHHIAHNDNQRVT